MMKELYFEASSTIITLILLGKYLEAVAKGKTSEAIKKLMGLQAKTARVVRNGVKRIFRWKRCKLEILLLCGPVRKFRWTEG